MSSKAKILKVLSVVCVVLSILEIVLLATGNQIVDVKHVGTAVLAALGAIVFFVIARQS